MWPNLKVIGQDQYLLFEIEVLRCYKIPLVHSFSVCGRGGGGGVRKGGVGGGGRRIFKNMDRNRNEIPAFNCVSSLNIAFYFLFAFRGLSAIVVCFFDCLFVCLFQFSSVQGGIYALGKAHMRSTLSLRRFPSIFCLYVLLPKAGGSLYAMGKRVVYFKKEKSIL